MDDSQNTLTPQSSPEQTPVGQPINPSPSEPPKNKGVMILLAILIVVVIAATVTFFVMNKDSDKEPDSQTNTNTSSNESTNSTAGTPLVIEALGLKINDPDNRQLVLVEKEVDPLGEGTPESVYLVTDKFTAETMVDCDYPAGISSITTTEYNDYKADGLTVLSISNKYYLVGGTNMAGGGCIDTEAAMQYSDELKQYIADNAVAL